MFLNSLEVARKFPKPARGNQSPTDYARALFKVYRDRSRAIGHDITYRHITALMDLAAQEALRGQTHALRKARIIKDELIDEWIDGAL